MFNWGNKSKSLLADAFTDLNYVMTEALTKYSTVDVGVIQSLRTVAQQKEILANGNSQILTSRHIEAYPSKNITLVTPGATQAELSRSCSFAVDIMAYLDGKGTFDADPYYAFAEAVRIAAVKTGVHVTWGGCWSDLNSVSSIKTAVDEYKARCIAAHKAGNRKTPDPFFDLGHYQLTTKYYPASYTVEVK